MRASLLSFCLSSSLNDLAKRRAERTMLHDGKNPHVASPTCYQNIGIWESGNNDVAIIINHKIKLRCRVMRYPTHHQGIRH